VSDEFAKELRKMARFRDRLVHIYWEVDDKQVYNIMRANLGDFKTFLNSISMFLGLDNMKLSGSDEA